MRPPPPEPQPSAPVSVVIRTRNSGATLGAALASVRSQSVPAQIVVVDSGSTDSTLQLAAPVDMVVHIAPGRFSYGGSLNTGAAAATAPVVAALSSHAVFPHSDWLAIAVEHIASGALGAFGVTADGDGQPLTAAREVDNRYLLAHPYWGPSNHAAAWSRSAWVREPFDEHLAAGEDREWSWRVTRAGGYLVADPRLLVPGQHRRAAGVVPYFRRLVKEATALGPLRPLPAYSLVDAARDLVRSQPSSPLISAGSRPGGRTRLVEVSARWQAGRVADRTGSPPLASPTVQRDGR